MAKKIDRSTPEKKFLPWALATAMFMQMLDSTIMNTSLPAIAEDLGESPLNMQNAIISYVLTLAVCMPASGFLADRIGTKRVFLGALAVFGIGSLLCAASPNLDTLVLARIIQGIGGSLMTPVGRLAMIKTFPKDEFVSALNYASIPALIGPVLGPLVGGYFSVYLSWHWIFLINIPFAVAGIIFGLKYMPDYYGTSPDFDFAGFLLFAAGSLALSMSLEMLGHSSKITIVLLVAVLGFAMLYSYYRYARRARNPLFPLSLFSLRTFRIGILGNLATRLGISSVPLLVPLMIQVEFGESAVVSGWIVAPMALTSMLGKSAVVRLLNRFGYRKILMTNTVIIGLLICCLGIPGIHANTYTFLPIVAVLGFFNSIQFTAMNTIAMADLTNNLTSAGNSLIAVNQQLAIGFGIAFGLVVLKLFQNSPITAGSSHLAFRYTFFVIGIFTVLSSGVFRRLQLTDGDNLRSRQ